MTGIEVLILILFIGLVAIVIFLNRDIQTLVERVEELDAGAHGHVNESYPPTIYGQTNSEEEGINAS